YLDFVRRTLRRDYHDQDLTEAGLRIYTSLEPRAQEQAEQALDHELARLDRQRKHAQEPLEGAIVVTSPQSGDVIAIVGGRNVGYDGFDRALDAHRSMGSLVKPFIYLTALESGHYNAATVVQDAPIDVKLANDKHWRPENFTHQTYGPVPVVRALAESLNLATVGVGLDVGLLKVAQTLQRFGLPQPPAQVPAMLLGAVEVTPLEAAQLFNGLASGGFRNPLRAVRAVISADGKPLKAFPLEVSQVASPEAVYQLDRMLVEVMERGTGRGARAVLPAGLTVAGKSGTSSDFRDSWFAGFSGSHLAVVWVGYDSDEPTGFTGAAAGRDAPGEHAARARPRGGAASTVRAPASPGAASVPSRPGGDCARHAGARAGRQRRVRSGGGDPRAGAAHRARQPAAVDRARARAPRR